MKASLILRVEALREKLSRLEDLASNAAEASDLAALRTDLAGPVRSLADLTARQSLLKQSGVPVAQPTSLAALGKRADTLREKFRSERKSATLKRGTAWKTLLADTVTASAELDGSLIAGWRDFRSILFSGAAPGKLEASLASTEENLEGLKSYRSTHEAFMRLFQSLPADGNVVDRARSLAKDLVAIAARFDFDVPPDVSKFLKAVQAGGAPLSLLTTEVLKWIQDRHATDSYRICSADTP